jgi:NTE family protein
VGPASAPSPSDRNPSVGPTLMRSRALVLGGGGVAGISWMLGVIDGLRRHGVDLAAADLIVGTSAGACVGAAVATDAMAPAVALQRRAETSEIVVPFDGEAYIEKVSRLATDAPDTRTALMRIANMNPLGPTVSEAERRAVIAARLPVHDWPQRRLVVSAVDAQAGELVTLDRDSGVGLVDAVTASCALPGVWPATTVADRRYVDGGIRSPTNADLADGHHVVVILVPIPTTGYVGEKLDRERAALESSDVHIIAANEASLAAIGPNALDPARRAVALDAGGAQAERELDAVAAKWSAPTG